MSKLHSAYTDNKIKLIDYVDNYFTTLQYPFTSTQYWVGIIHHTHFIFSSNNIIELFNNDVFVESLSSCKLLIANKVNVQIELKKKQIKVLKYKL